jgi:hypothetical protein
MRNRITAKVNLTGVPTHPFRDGPGLAPHANPWGSRAFRNRKVRHVHVLLIRNTGGVWFAAGIPKLSDDN